MSCSGKCSIKMLAPFFWEGSIFWIFCRLAMEVEVLPVANFPRKSRGTQQAVAASKASPSPSCFHSGIKLEVMFSVYLVWGMGEGLPWHLEKSG